MNIDDWKSQIKRGTLEFCILLMIEDYVSSSWQESAEGLPPRKYYSITDKGLEYISAMSKEWNNLLNAINEIKGE